jgi:hypothetical protein
VTEDSSKLVLAAARKVRHSRLAIDARKLF